MGRDSPADVRKETESGKQDCRGWGAFCWVEDLRVLCMANVMSGESEMCNTGDGAGCGELIWAVQGGLG